MKRKEDDEKQIGLFGTNPPPRRRMVQVGMFDRAAMEPVKHDPKITHLPDRLLEWVPKPAAAVAAAVERAERITRRKQRATSKTKAKPKRGPVGREAVRAALQRCHERLKACDCGKKK